MPEDDQAKIKTLLSLRDLDERWLIACEELGLTDEADRIRAFRAKKLARVHLSTDTGDS